MPKYIKNVFSEDVQGGTYNKKDMLEYEVHTGKYKKEQEIALMKYGGYKQKYQLGGKLAYTYKN